MGLPYKYVRPPQSRFRRFCCCAVDATSSHLSTCIYDRESMSPKPSSLAILHREKTNKVLGSDLRDCSLASSSSLPQLIYLFVGRTPRVIAFNVNFVRPISIFIWSSLSRNHKSRTISTLKSYFTYLIC
jgi:hypothetical protein